MKTHAKNKQNKRGLTLVELIAVLAIVGIVGTLAATAIVSSVTQYTRITQQETAKKAVTLLQQYVTSAVRYADAGTLAIKTEEGYTAFYAYEGQLQQKTGEAETPLVPDATVYGGLYYTAEWGAEGKVLTYTIRVFTDADAALDAANAIYSASATVRLQNAAKDIVTEGTENPSLVFSCHTAA